MMQNNAIRRYARRQRRGIVGNTVVGLASFLAIGAPTGGVYTDPNVSSPNGSLGGDMVRLGRDMWSVITREQQNEKTAR